MRMITKLRDKIKSRKLLNHEKAKGQELRNRLDLILFLLWWKMNPRLIKKRWELMDLPPGCKPLGYKWIFKKKMKADGTIDKYKARLVIKGFKQREGLDYFDTYSPVMLITSIRMILAIAALRKLEVYQMDVKTVFLNGDLEEEIYMNQPGGFIALGQEGLADVILGIKIIRTQNGLVLSQAHYVDKTLNTHNAGDYGLARTPIDTNLHLSRNRDVGVAQLEYSRIIGMLMYLMMSSRPDLAYAVSRLSRHPVVIEGYNDENWISNIKDSRSTSGYVFTVGGVTISWKSSKQTVIATSMMESEFIALDKCGEEAEWLCDMC
nr:retrotransposon protein, putative, Ty1-copia subclass [Tanacetum cinerariifolium]